MRLLIFGHHSHTGFGIVTQELAERFLDAGVDVRILAVNHRGEPVRGKLAGRVWPTAMLGDAYGGALSAYAIAGPLWAKLDPADEWQPDAVLAIADVSGLTAHMGNQPTQAAIEVWREARVLHYCPIEGDNLPPIWRGIWSIVEPVAMSQYGQRVMSGFLGRHVPMIYHGVDTETFRPVSMNSPLIVGGKRLGTREACKAHFGLAGRKVILRADRNSVRKFYYRLIEAFVPIAQADPEVDLLLHCQAQDIEGIDIMGEIARRADDLDGRVHFTKAHDTWKGFERDELAALYNAADLYVSTTGGEGFGLTLAESLACETPVVVTEWAAETEVVAKGGVLVPPLMDEYGEPVRYHSSMGMDWAIPDPRKFVPPVLDLLNKPAKRRALGAEGRAHVKRSFNWDTAAASFLTLLEEPDASVAV